MAAPHSSCFSLNMLFVGFLLAIAHLPLNVLCIASFSTELMRRDHPESPLHNTISTDYLRSAGSDNPNSPLIIDTPFLNLFYLPPAYAVNVRIGQRNQTVRLAISFTGPPWLCCITCSQCYKSTQRIFKQTKSKSYVEHNCEDEECKTLGGKCDEKKKCKIKVELMYPINGYVKGTAASERVVLGIQGTRGIYLKKTTIGCIHKTFGDFHKGSVGMLGLGPGPLSFVSQLRHHSYEDMFSYCLPSRPNVTSRLYFGSQGNMPDDVSTPMDTSSDSYIVTSGRFQIGGPNFRTNFIFEQKFMMDPAYYFTYVSRKALNAIISEMKKRVRLPHMSLGRVDRIHELCFDISPGWNYSMFPEITFRMVNGALFVLKMENAFERVDQAMCLTILSNEGDGTKISIFGSRAQLNRRFFFDISGKTLSFRTEKC